MKRTQHGQQLMVQMEHNRLTKFEGLVLQHSSQQTTFQHAV
jgi:hypothetical protein